MTILYDPPGGWRYGFPRAYAPFEGETLTDTLVRDGYPESEADFAARYCRFIDDAGYIEQLERRAA
jgi:hypothetical protein